MNNKYFFTFLLCVCISTLSFGQSVTVSGSGCTPNACFSGATSIDATYPFNNTAGGRNLYNDPTTRLLIQFSGGEWKIWDCINDTYYTNPNATSPDPPATGWSTGVGSCTGSPAPTLSGSVIALPVELISFTGKNDGNSIRLNWNTASEKNNKGFDIERSLDGENFEAITFVEGNGTTVIAKEYSYTDNNLIEGGVYYYRLKQVDFDGQFVYSKILTVSLEEVAAEMSTFYPNPTTGITNINYMAATSTDVTVIVYNITGQKVQQSVESVAEGMNILQLDYSALSRGNYFVLFTSVHGQRQQKLIIQ